MADRYDDYEKLALSTNQYSSWVNMPEHLVAFNTALSNYYETHKNAPKVDNTNCPDCPKFPIVGDAYWDKAGRNWVFWEGNKWKDLSGEYCEGEGCDNSWKNGIDVQFVHQTFYNAKLEQYENNALQASLGGINDEFKQQLWRSTQFITVHALKDNWVEEQTGDDWWLPVWHNTKSMVNNIKVANGDMTYYAKATLDGIFAATDVFLVKAIATGIYKIGIKKLIIEGGAKQITKQVYYTACKKAITLRLAYTLRFGTPEATTFFNKQLAKTLEIYDLATKRYIKYDIATGETFIGEVLESEKAIVYEGYGKIIISEGLTETEQCSFVLTRLAETESAKVADAECVFHVKSNEYAQNVIDAIDPKYFNATNRFGRGFYVAENGETAIAEVVYHGVDVEKAKVIRFSLDKSKLKVLDLTDANTAKQWNLGDAMNYENNMISSNSENLKYDKFQELAIKAQNEGFNAIKFKSFRGTSNNLVIFGEDKDFFKQTLQPQMIMPAIE